MASLHSRFPAELPDWNNLDVIHRNALPPRSTFDTHRSEEAALTGSGDCQLLSGTWKFAHSASPFQGYVDFWKGLDTSGWADITVPGHWQLQGLGGRPHYTNLPYPFPVDPPHVPYETNETGRYVKTFRVVAELASGAQLRLRFDGVDSAFKVWVNGAEVGYSQGARNPTEFDISPWVRIDEENVLAVEVYARCDGTYIEDQDQWWLSGIFRDVTLHYFPTIHPEDIFIRTELDKSYRDASMLIYIPTNEKTDVAATLFDKSGSEIAHGSKLATASGSTIAMNVSNPVKWTAETPELYTLLLSCSHFHVAFKVGFRQVEIIDGVFCVNGSPVKFKGVNRHEHHPKFGRAVPYDYLKEDLLMMKRAGINALRTCHYPNDPRLYDLADELGLWVMDEADLECHGFERIGTDKPEAFTSDNPEWEEAYVDRARQMVLRDRNHPSVITWSLGNEAFYGRNHRAMCDLIRTIDPTRPIHYEQDREAESVDMLSVMYPTIGEVMERAAVKEWEKPYVLCEFVYAGGNGPGCADEYFDIFYQYPRCMGGFIWEWANHGLLTKTSDGEEYFGYGGDFGDFPNDGAIMINGILNSDHKPAPSFSVFQKAIEAVKVVGFDQGVVTIMNRYDFLTLDHLQLSWSLTEENQPEGPRQEASIPSGIKPHSTVSFQIEGLPQYFASETHLNLWFTLRSGTAWAHQGHEVAWSQIPLTGPSNSCAPTTSQNSEPTLTVMGGTELRILSATKSSKWTIDLVKGTLTSWVRDGEEVMAKPLVMDFWRATIEADRRSHGMAWLKQRVDQASYTSRSVEWSEGEGVVTIKTEGRVAPPVLAWGVELTTTYTVRGDTLAVEVHGKPSGLNLPELIPRIGLSTALRGVDRARWWGRGPGESYLDKKSNQRYGTWEKTIDDLHVEYEVPQESGNRTDVRWVEFLGNRESGSKRRLRVSFGLDDGRSFAASHFVMADVAEARHPHELRRKDETFVRFDWVHQGTGSGLKELGTVEPQHKLPFEEFKFQLQLD